MVCSMRAVLEVQNVGNKLLMSWCFASERLNLWYLTIAFVSINLFNLDTTATNICAFTQESYAYFL